MADVKKNNGDKKKDTYHGLHESTQTFGKIGLVEAVNGNVVLRGREGERDHLYPIGKALKRYHETVKMYTSMARHGIRGWDTMVDIANELKAAICEAVGQRKSLNLDTPADVLSFVDMHGKI